MLYDMPFAPPLFGRMPIFTNKKKPANWRAGLSFFILVFILYGLNLGKNVEKQIHYIRIKVCSAAFADDVIRSFVGKRFFIIANPRPVPLYLREKDASSCLNGSKIESTSSSGMHHLFVRYHVFQ
jgi:hypothetical protein